MITPISRIHSLLKDVDAIIDQFSEFNTVFEEIECKADLSNLANYSDSSNAETNNYARTYLKEGIKPGVSIQLLYGVFKRFQAFRNEVSHYPEHHYLFACDLNGRHYNNINEYILLGVKYSRFEKMRLHVLDPDRQFTKSELYKPDKLY